ncbi:hypothetical protein LJC71_05040 [Desulfosarcina sp. OttesenSCG-928-A07]|nr:hypothetical protein [Desulfosarcina sp. OttesenSCG-928-G17]MDL2329104.1 hypothetical protein [Desulfosarcina sp. OttesenSCG-928-A07]
MKNIAKELKSVARQLEILTRKTERMIMVVKNAALPVAPKIKKSVSATPTDQVLIIMKRFKKGISVTSLREKSGFNEKQISNIVHRACKKGVIKRIRRGVYSLYKDDGYENDSENMAALPKTMDFC